MGNAAKKIDSKNNKIQELKDLIRNSSKTTLEEKIKNLKIDLQEAEDKSLLKYDHWISNIKIKASIIQIVFRVHFFTKDAKVLCKDSLGKSNPEITHKIAHDFIQEYSNLTSGTIERGLVNSGIDLEKFDLAVHLPEKSPSYDEVNLDKELKSNKFADCWKLSFNSGDIFCVSEILISDFDALSKLKEIGATTLSVTDSGDVEFL